MKRVPAALALLLVAGHTLTHAATPAEAFAGSRQLLVVTTPGAEAIDGKLQRFQRSADDQPWQAVGDPIAVVVGRNGLAWGNGLIPPRSATVRKREGDGKAPEGVFALGTAFGYAAAAPAGSQLPYLPLTSTTECVDDTASSQYNRIVDRSASVPDWSSSERMREMGEAYRWGVVVNHNHIASAAGSALPASDGGSCIFLHVWQGPGQGTAGCTAMSRPDIESLLAWLEADDQPRLVQLTAGSYARLGLEWRLP